MSTDRPFRKISELVAALSNAEKGLTAGTLGIEDLETACGDARELYERLIVLRHKARESAVGHPTNSFAGTGVPGPGSPLTAKEEEPVPPNAPPLAGPGPVRLDTRPAPEAISPRQTSLIEAIASSEQEAGAGETGKGSTSPGTAQKAAMGVPKPPPSVAEKLGKAALTDLSKAITLSHKFWFVAELFNGDRITYEKAIEKLNGFADHSSAQRFVETEVIAKLKKPADPEALSTFNDLVKRRYA